MRLPRSAGTPMRVADYDAVLALRAATFAPALNRRGNALLALEQPDAALAAYDAALAIEPDNPEMLNNRSVALLELGGPMRRWKAASARSPITAAICRRTLQSRQCLLGARAVRRSPRKFRGGARARAAARRCAQQYWAGAGGLETAGGSAEKYRRALWRSIRDHLGALHNRANRIADLGSLDEALAAVRASPACDPAHADALNTRGVVLGKLGRYAEALGKLRRGADGCAPERIDIEINRGIGAA